jgi:putative CocE/NonD family hydrolase
VRVRSAIAALFSSALALGASAPATSQTAPVTSDIPAGFTPSDGFKDFTIRAVQIPMRDGVKLHTNLVIAKGLQRAPIVFVRTPYSADGSISRLPSNRYSMALPTIYAELAAAGYIIAVQDVRGRHRSGGDYVIGRPLVGPLNPTKVDHSTDTWDSIDWMVKNVPETNGKVGTTGVSYGGFTTLMSLVNPHPALRAAVPVNPMVDGWKGDDWFHNGAYRQSFTLDWVYWMSADKSSRHMLHFDRHDTYESWLKAGSAGDMAKLYGVDKLPAFQKLVAHPSYDEYWQQQALDRILAKEPLKVPTLHVHSLWDQEDIYGPPAVYAATETNDQGNDKNFMIIGPWRHGQSNAPDGAKLGAIDFNGNTSAWYRSKVLIPFLNQHLKDDGTRAGIAPVTAFETGANVWHSYERWPMSCSSGCPSRSRHIYLSPDGGLGWSAPAGSAGFAEYISDPARPVTYRQRPLLSTFNPQSTWGQWLVDDQRFAEARPDVVTFVSEVLGEDVRVAGQPIAKFFASTSGTDSDFVVKLIDVYPDEHPAAPELGGYELAISMDILRGRYRDDPSKPTPIPANKVVGYEIKLPNVSHKFLKGHRIMVQIQSSLFPLYDRNPQRFVPNIFTAKKSDYVKATQRIYASAKYPSRIELPVIP